MTPFPIIKLKVSNCDWSRSYAANLIYQFKFNWTQQERILIDERFKILLLSQLSGK